MKKVFTLMMCTFIASAAFAQQEEGDYQVQAQFTYLTLEGFSAGTLYLNGSKFFTKNIEAGVSPQLTFGGGTTTFNLSLYGNYNFLTSDAKLVPYAGAQIYLYDLGGEGGSAGFGLKGGIRYFITERVNIDTGPQLVFVSGSSLFLYTAGLGFIFGRRN